MTTQITAKQWIGLVGISLLGFTCFLDITIVSNALPAIRKAFGASDTQLQWMLNTIYVALCACMATIGRMGDVFGLRKVFYISMIVMGLASLMCGLSGSMEELIIFRAIQGVGLASITLSAALVSHNFPLEQQPKAMGVFSAVAGLGLALGPVIGGFLVDLFSWRWIFFFNVPIVVIGISICALTVTEKNKHADKQTIDWFGALFFILGITSLVTTVIQGESWGWTSAASIFGFMVALIALISFVITEKKVAMPLMPFPLLANSIFISAALTCATCGAFIAILLFFDPLYLQSILGFNATHSGWILLSTSLAYILMSPIAGVITNRLSAKIGTWLVCLLLMMAAFFHAQFNLDTPLWVILAGLISFGLAWGTVNVPPVVAVLNSVGTAYAGAMLGALWTLFNLGSALVLALLGIVFRFFEYQFLLQNLDGVKTALTTTHLQLLRQLVNAPEQSQQILSHFPGAIANQIMPAYSAAFMHSYNLICWILFGLATFAFLIVFFFMKMGKKSSSQVEYVHTLL